MLRMAYRAPNGTEGTSFCTTAGASVDFCSEDMRRMIVNATYFLTGLDVPDDANVAYVDPYHPSFFGFIKDEDWYRRADLQPEDLDLGTELKMKDPPNAPAWPFRN